jgi:hypothetical protein
VLDGEDGGWWPAAAPVSFYDTDEGRRSLGTSQMKKNDTRGGAHRRGWGSGAPVRFRCGGGAPWLVMASEVTGSQRSGGGTQAGHLARTGGDDSGALDGFNVGAGEKKGGGEELARSRA